jgi:hypothetical protein
MTKSTQLQNESPFLAVINDLSGTNSPSTIVLIRNADDMRRLDRLLKLRFEKTGRSSALGRLSLTPNTKFPGGTIVDGSNLIKRLDEADKAGTLPDDLDDFIAKGDEALEQGDNAPGAAAGGSRTYTKTQTKGNTQDAAGARADIAEGFMERVRRNDTWGKVFLATAVVGVTTYTGLTFGASDGATLNIDKIVIKDDIRKTAEITYNTNSMSSIDKPLFKLRVGDYITFKNDSVGLLKDRKLKVYATESATVCKVSLIELQNKPPASDNDYIVNCSPSPPCTTAQRQFEVESKFINHVVGTVIGDTLDVAGSIFYLMGNTALGALGDLGSLTASALQALLDQAAAAAAAAAERTAAALAAAAAAAGGLGGAASRAGRSALCNSVPILCGGTLFIIVGACIFIFIMLSVFKKDKDYGR